MMKIIMPIARPAMVSVTQVENGTNGSATSASATGSSSGMKSRGALGSAAPASMSAALIGAHPG